ncbi:HEPN domain-containing protein [Suttonella ornithocola]|uniref:Uncharacterized protein n=1 Tax=Suttonella ornithocola TaxID=279832 RepID=A0A380N174_9GAMM|nr:HEPN domain-containing protein [Suttonella ornithocola]SUO97883.1 Uncharacterised protein [Suttonella ornithocola]
MSNGNDNLSLRLNRAESWLKKAENAEDEDTRFIALWIAFNAAYACDVGIVAGDKNHLRQFLTQIVALDEAHIIYDLIWQRFPKNIRVLLDNKYVFQPFWDFHNGKIQEKVWLEDFAAEKDKVKKALAQQDTDLVLFIIFDRIYTLHNQIIHGGASFSSSVNRPQVRDCSEILAIFVPLMIDIMKKNLQRDWGKPFYPLIKEQE